MELEYKLDAFNGPLDLLLNLIDTNKINIYDIPIVEITEQYLVYVKNMHEQDMDIMSEFLVMASTLVSIKAKMLLPRIGKPDEEEEDPRAELVERLLEYKKYKYASFELAKGQLDAERLIFKPSTIPDEVKNYVEEVNVEEILADVNLAKLYDIFTSIVRKQNDKIDPIRSKFGKIKREEISLEEKVNYIYSMLLELNEIRFSHLLEEQSSKLEIIVTFLAVLELMKIGKIIVVQENIFDDITIRPIGESANG
ncbi:MAG: segregation and condensation protein [Clostridiales bacterium]|jgi:segregation and condensation protein A|nr:segregation and condensation protein [Clostridiales bacterium]